MKQRSSGILMHITSLPSEFGIGDLGEGAYSFIDFLASSKQSVWQILPLTPTDPICDNSPYSSHSAKAFNTLLISPALLIKDGFLVDEDLVQRQDFNREYVDYQEVVGFKSRLFDIAYQRFVDDKIFESEFEDFKNKQKKWLDNYALFIAIKNHFNGHIWTQWPEEYKNRNESKLQEFTKDETNKINQIKFCQFLFFRQWMKLKKYANQKGVQIIGDIPIYVIYDSADVWANREVFKLDKSGELDVVAGVPPDYFSQTGQRWGNPVYDWDYLESSKFEWWLNRFEHNLNLFDIVRVDHFRGFVNFWEIPVHEPTAINGQWQDVPTNQFFQALKIRFKELPIIAEDLGMLEDEVRAKIKSLGFPGMKILLFAFGGEEDHIYLPHTYDLNCVVYTGTHDNNTVKGWLDKDSTSNELEKLSSYLEQNITNTEQINTTPIHRQLIQLAMQSNAKLAIFPMQDVLGLDAQSRMNTPGTGSGNWRWRLLDGQINSCLCTYLLQSTKASKRA